MPSEDAKPGKLKKQEEAEEADEKCLSSILKAHRKNPVNAASLAPKSRPKDPKVKKEAPEDGDDFDVPIGKSKNSIVSRPKTPKLKKEVKDDDEPISVRKTAAKSEQELNKKKKTIKVEEKKGSVVMEQNGKKKEKKVYDLPGQKRDPPEERDPLRIFYETLYEQLPSSEMAQIWMMESGLLPIDEARKVYEKKLKKKNQQTLSSPIKANTGTKKTQSATVKKNTPSSPVSSVNKKTTGSTVQTKESKKRKIAGGRSDEDSDDDFIVNRSTKKQRAS